MGTNNLYSAGLLSKTERMGGCGGMKISEIKFAQTAQLFSIEFIVCGYIHTTCTKQRIKQEDSERKRSRTDQE